MIIFINVLNESIWQNLTATHHFKKFSKVGIERIFPNMIKRIRNALSLKLNKGEDAYYFYLALYWTSS